MTLRQHYRGGDETRQCALVLFALLAYCNNAGAADPATLPPVVATGSRLPQSEVLLSQSPVVLSAPEVDTLAPATWPRLLRGISTIYVDQSGTPGGISSLYLRGADPSHTAVLIDGVKVSDPTNTRGGGIDLSLIDVHGIARVELLPGSSSAIYGADAMAGVINFITRGPAATGLRLSAGAGGGRFRTAQATGTVRSRAVGLTAHAATTDDGHAQDTSHARWRTGSLRLSAGEVGDRHFTAWIRNQHQHSGSFPDDSGGLQYAIRRELERRDTDGTVGAATWETRTRWGALRVYSNMFRQDSNVQSPGVAPGLRDPAGIPRTTTESHYARSAFGTIAVFGAGPDGNAPALIGVQYEKERGEVASTLLFGPVRVPANFELERNTRSIFGEARAGFGNHAMVHGAVRSDATGAHGTRTTLRGGLSYRAVDAATLAVNYGTGFKPPSFFALGHPLVGNRDLRPEESRTIEVSVSNHDATQHARQVRYRAVLFSSKYENLIDFDAGPPPRLVNRGDFVISGYEASAALEVDSKLHIRASVTGLQIDVPTGTPPLRNRPKLRATAGVAYELAPSVVAAIYGAWTSRVFDSSIPTGATYLSSYLVADASLTYTMGQTRFTFALDNVFDKDFQQFIGFPGRARRARVEFSVDI
jgi:vitamin B12 transporter